MGGELAWPRWAFLREWRAQASPGYAVFPCSTKSTPGKKGLRRGLDGTLPATLSTGHIPAE